MLVYCASSNMGKLEEFKRCVHDLGLDNVHIAVLPRIKELPVPEETGETFRENAILKAKYYSGGSREWVLAEDSGLCVKALGGAPGVYSARYAGRLATEAANLDLLLNRMRGSIDRSAYYACVIALARAGTVLATFEGRVDGTILEEPRGSGGFGYDPVFLHDGMGQTLAEMDRPSKQRISHRGIATRALVEYLLAHEGKAIK